jgi:hypothetical protein
MFAPQQQQQQEQSSISPEQSDLLELQDRLLGIHVDLKKNQLSDTSAKLVDSVLAKEFSKLSAKEQLKTYEELHGVNDCVEETPAFVEKSLRQLEEEVSKIANKSAYDMAEQQSKEFVTNRNFRIMFLRADGFHPGKAATRLVGYFEGIRRYFGDRLLTRRIQYSDLDRNDQACVKAGYMQILPFRDRSGRAIFSDVDTFQEQSYVTPRNRLKASMYMWLILAEDQENQKRGMVLIALKMGSLDLKRGSRTLAQELPRAISWLPIRVCALHFCSDDSFSGVFFRLVVLGVPADSRARIRFHRGTYTEIMYSLLGFGIPVDLIPFSQNGAIKKTNLNRWIAKNIARETELALRGTFSGIDLPTRNDVLMGKGKPYQYHHGNVHLRELVDAHKEDYHAAPQSPDKMDVVYKVMSIIKNRSGRFLEKDYDGWWRELPDADVMEKVRTRFQRTNMKVLPQGNDRAHAKLDDGKDDASMFLHQGKRPRFDANCCGT